MEIRRGFLLAAVLLYPGCSSPPPGRQKASPAADPVKILAFYARETSIPAGGKTVLCYSVSNASSVRIDPPVEGVSPSLTRCVEVSPRAETRYTLTAVGSDGQSVSQSATVGIGGNAGDDSTVPKIASFKIDGAQKDYSGKTVYTVSFSAPNAVEISIDPPAFPALHGAPFGQFSVRPEKTTTYTLTAKSKDGRTAQKKLTLQVP